MHTVFSYPLTIKASHLDTFGHVNNAMYLSILEEARWDMLSKANYTKEQIKAKGVGPTILEISIQFKKELFLNDQIVVETQLLSWEKKVGKLSHRILRNNDVCSTAEYTLGIFSLIDRKLITPSIEWLHVIGYQE